MLLRWQRLLGLPPAELLLGRFHGRDGFVERRGDLAEGGVDRDHPAGTNAAEQRHHLFTQAPLPQGERRQVLLVFLLRIIVAIADEIERSRDDLPLSLRQRAV